jgi:polyphenol oxidase
MSVASIPIPTMRMSLLYNALIAMDRLARGFKWVEAAWGPVLTCPALSPVAIHGWTTRALKLELSDEQCTTQWTTLAAHADLTIAGLSRLTQVHGRDIVAIDRPGGIVPRADGQSTARPDVLLAIRVADCVPLLIADRRTGAVAAVHAGWRGTAAGIAHAAIGHMHAHYGTNPGDVIAAVGPSIGPCSYIVGEDVRGAFRAAGWGEAPVGSWFANVENATPNSQPPTSNLTLDLWRANRDQLIDAGVPQQSVYVAELCTACNPNAFYSYRRDGKGTGRMVGFIARKTPSGFGP